MTYKLIALDIDGTLLNSRSQLTESTRHAVQAAVGAGYKVCLVSGRRPVSMAMYSREMGLTHPLIGYNGAVVADPVTLKSIRAATMKREHLAQILERWEEAGLTCFAYCDHLPGPDIYYSVPTSWPEMQAYVTQETSHLTRLGSLSHELPSDPLRLMVGDSEAQTTLAQELAEPLLDLSRFKTFHTRHYGGTWFYEVFASSVGKAVGLSFLCEYFGILPEQIIAVGDHVNDLDMIEFAGLGVAMGNSQQVVKDTADLTIGHHDEDGLAEFISGLAGGKGASR
jgi:Cof subfamily protein (haloacid dehalogenase superfamily)